LGFAANRIRYIPNFVSGTAATNQHIELPGTLRKRIICVANIHPDKDHLTLFRAMKLVVEKIPDAHLLLAGEARDANYLKTVTAEMVKLGLVKNVSLLGQQKNVPLVLGACDIGVMSSVSEGLPMALLEYGMAGLPVVATDVGQCAEVLGNGSAGIIVPPAEPGRLGAALTSLLESEESRRELGEKFRQRVHQSYSADAVISEVCRMYEEVLHLASDSTDPEKQASQKSGSSK
jgi:glycosyltransferase involved in cell wall biosynthesis